MAIDLGDPRLLLTSEVLEDPRELYDLLRRDAPVWQIPGQDTFLVSDPALIRQAVARTEDFSSNLVSLLHAAEDGRLAPVTLAPYGDALHAIATADPPRHTVHRRVLQPHLGPTAVAGLEPMVRDVVDGHLLPLRAGGRVDAVAAIADPVPAAVICNVIGLPVEDAGRLVSLVGSTGMLLDGVTNDQGMTTAAESTLALMTYTQDHLAATLGQPPQKRLGLLGVVADAIDHGDLTTEEAHTIALVLINAGTETTASLIATTIRLLAEQPDLQTELRSHPERIADTLEQVLRGDGPFQFHYRFAPNDTVLADTAIPAGSRVLLMWAAANRPSSNGPEAIEGDRLPPHFAFGRGLHFCIGAPLARLESRVTIERLLTGTTSISLDPDHVPVRRPSIFIRRHTTLPVTIDV